MMLLYSSYFEDAQTLGHNNKLEIIRPRKDLKVDLQTIRSRLRLRISGPVAHVTYLFVRYVKRVEINSLAQESGEIFKHRSRWLESELILETYNSRPSYSVFIKIESIFHLKDLVTVGEHFTFAITLKFKKIERCYRRYCPYTPYPTRSPLEINWELRSVKKILS